MTNTPLTETERLTFAALLRAQIRLDRYTTPDEQNVLHTVAAELLGGTVADVADTLAALMEQSAERYKDDEALRAAAAEVTRQEAREGIFGALYEISAAGTITMGESSLLDWLGELWQITIRAVDAPAG